MFYNLAWVLACLAGCLAGYFMPQTVIIVLSCIGLAIVLYYFFFVKDILIFVSIFYQTAFIFFLVSMWIAALAVNWEPLQIFILPLKNFLFR